MRNKNSSRCAALFWMLMLSVSHAADGPCCLCLPPPRCLSALSVRTHTHKSSTSHTFLLTLMYSQRLKPTAAFHSFSSYFILILSLFTSVLFWLIVPQHLLLCFLHFSLQKCHFYFLFLHLLGCLLFPSLSSSHFFCFCVSHSESPMSSPLQGSQPLCLWFPQQQALPQPSKLLQCLDLHMFHRP